MLKDQIWFDPFANNNSPANITNDINPNTTAQYHLDAVDFVAQLKKDYPDQHFDGMLFDPPYSTRQISEHYQSVGIKASQLDTSNRFYTRIYNPAMDLIKIGGYVISFGWNSNGMGKVRGFEKVEILLVAHGGQHNDTICTVKQRVSYPQQELNLL
jgi:hypothetical protein